MRANGGGCHQIHLESEVDESAKGSGDLKRPGGTCALDLVNEPAEIVQRIEKCSGRAQ